MSDTRFLDDFRRDGVIVVPSLLTSDELIEVRDRITRYQTEQLPTLPKGDYTLEPDGHTVRNLWRMEQHDPFFLAMASRRSFLELVAPLVNGVPVLMGIETFNKPARVGSAVPPHQDNAYFCQTPPDVLTVWIAIDPATSENGAVEYLRGSHLALRPHTPSGVRGNSFGIVKAPIDEFSRFLGEIKPGDALIHHSQTVHFSAANHSNQPRLSLIFVYRGQHTTTDTQLKEAYAKAASLTPSNV
jgi:phytanoyl-CoA hydroxylase